jgi:transcriptional regulator with XRE-family HTH domain
MYTLAEWLKDQIRARDLTQQKVSVYAGVSGATLSDILNRGHIPKMELLFRLADFFETPREQVLRLAARMPIEGSEAVDQDDYLIQDLLEAFRQVPDDRKPLVLQQVQLAVRLATLPPVRLIGEEGEEADAQGSPE